MGCVELVSILYAEHVTFPADSISRLHLPCLFAACHHFATRSRGVYNRLRGSSASRMPSPKKLMLSEVSKINSPGQKTVYGL